MDSAESFALHRTGLPTSPWGCASNIYWLLCSWIEMWGSHLLKALDSVSCLPPLPSYHNCWARTWLESLTPVSKRGSFSGWHDNHDGIAMTLPFWYVRKYLESSQDVSAGMHLGPFWGSSETPPMVKNKMHSYLSLESPCPSIPSCKTSPFDFDHLTCLFVYSHFTGSLLRNQAIIWER